MVVSIEEVSSSLVREYLSRKGLKRTIACMDEEQPRTEASINNRSDLRQILHMEGLYKNNKVQKNPLKTLLEIIVKHHIERHKNDKAAFNSDPVPSTPAINLNAASPSPPSLMNETKTVDCTITKLRSLIEEETCPSQGTKSLPAMDRHSTHNQTDFGGDCSESRKGLPLNTPFHGTESFTGRESERKSESTQKNRTNRTRRGMMAAPTASAPQESNRKRQTRRVGVPQLLLGNEEDNGHSVHGPPESVLHRKSAESGIAEVSRPGSCRERQQSRSTPSSQCEEGFNKDQLKTIKARSPTGLHAYDLHMSELILDDIDDDDDELRELSAMSFQASIPKHSYAGHAMDQHTATALKELLLGSSSRFFSSEWRNQGFTFSDDLKYGIMQNKGGPCGVLAAVQACLLKKLLFESADSSITGPQRLRPSSATRTQCLVLAAAEILWRAGEEKQATVAIHSERNHFIPTGHYKAEGVLEKITCFSVDNFKDLQRLLEQHIEQFESGALSCILLTISAVLSRSIEKIREDMDVPTTSLIGAHGYCTQELVNLLLCGHAVSNVFDNDMELDSGNGNLTLLKGIKGRCDIGLLSLFEHYNICKVGTYLQTPHFPIWVVCSESHFSVLFGLQRELLTNQDRAQEFDLYYYDGLANQQEEIRLTVSVGMSALCCQDDDPDLIPPLEHCIRTKWKDASVSWNDTEPIL